MDPCQDPSFATLTLRSEWIGALPLINHFLARLDLDSRLDRFVPTLDRRVRVPYGKALGVLLRSILVEREPIYGQQELVSEFAPECFGLEPDEAVSIGDDAIGRALDHLFDADRACLLTDAVVAATREFDVALDELHNDSTSVSFCGQYRGARGRRFRGKRAPAITYGFSKDHRPDLKQLLFILTTSRDGGVPLQFRCADGNTNDSPTHQDTWDALCKTTGRSDFLYVADSKLCSRDAMDHIHAHGGRLVTVLPRTRLEDREFRQWIQTNTPDWTLVRDAANPRVADGPRDRWWVYRHHLPSREGWPVIWLRSDLLALRQERQRRERLAHAQQQLEDLRAKLLGSRPRLRSRAAVAERVDEILSINSVAQYLTVRPHQLEEHTFKQTKRGRPGPRTTYVRKTRKRWTIEWTLNQPAVDYDRNSDGMYPLLTNDRALSDAEVFEAHKRQPSIEKRFQQTKSVLEIAPVFLKNEARIEAFFFVYFLALLTHALIERELRRSMAASGVDELPLYPEERMTRRPTANQILKLFSSTHRHAVCQDQTPVRTFPPELSALQLQVLSLLAVPPHAFCRQRPPTRNS
jgi:transposase